MGRNPVADGRTVGYPGGVLSRRKTACGYRRRKTVPVFNRNVCGDCNGWCAVYEFRTVMFDFGARIRIYSAENGVHDRDLPKFATRPSREPQQNLPLVSYAPGDSLLAVTLPTAFSGKVYLIRSNDGGISREYKGYCHAFSPDGTMFVAQGTVFSTQGWSVLGKLPRSTRTCAFSPTEPVVICVTQDAVRRFRIGE